MKRKVILFLWAIFMVLTQSCQKKDQGTTSEANLASDITAALANVTSTAVNQSSSAEIQSVAVTDFDSIVRSFGKHFTFPKNNMKFSLKHISDCATVTISDTVYPQTITIDYGTGCSDGHRHVKSGKIIIQISDSLTIAGATETITYENFYVDSCKVDFSGTLKNLGKNTSGNWVVETSYKQTTTTVSGNVVVESFHNSVVWTSGFATTSKSDDVYHKTGSGSIKVNDSLSYSCTITNALVYDYSCGNITSGTMELYRNGNTVVIDYGDGTCDSIATVNINGTTQELNIASIGFKDGSKFDKKGPHGHGKHKF
jgi:hypothetical protein